MQRMNHRCAANRTSAGRITRHRLRQKNPSYRLLPTKTALTARKATTSPDSRAKGRRHASRTKAGWWTRLTMPPMTKTRIQKIPRQTTTQHRPLPQTNPHQTASSKAPRRVTNRNCASGSTKPLRPLPSHLAASPLPRRTASKKPTSYPRLTCSTPARPPSPTTATRSLTKWRCRSNRR